MANAFRECWISGIAGPWLWRCVANPARATTPGKPPGVQWLGCHSPRSSAWAEQDHCSLSRASCPSALPVLVDIAWITVRFIRLCVLCFHAWALACGASLELRTYEGETADEIRRRTFPKSEISMAPGAVHVPPKWIISHRCSIKHTNSTVSETWIQNASIKFKNHQFSWIWMCSLAIQEEISPRRIVSANTAYISVIVSCEWHASFVFCRAWGNIWSAENGNIFQLCALFCPSCVKFNFSTPQEWS